MTILFEQDMPAGVPMELVDAVTEEMGVDKNPPEGLIVHVDFEKDGHVHIVDVWDSEQAYQQFLDTRLNPAVAKVAAARGLDMSQMPEPENHITTVHGMIRGR
jgi:hypothetical protein